MVIGTLIISLHIPCCGSLKGKRHALKGAMTRTRNTFNVSICEVEHQDLWQRSTLAAVCVNTEGPAANSTMSKIVELWERVDGVEILDYSIDIEHVNLSY